MTTNREGAILLMCVDFDATYLEGGWAGKNAASWGLVLERTCLPWPLRMQVHHQGPGTFAIVPDLDHLRSKWGVWVPSVMHFKIERAEGMRCRGQLMMREDKRPYTVEILREHLKQADADTKAMFDKFKDVPWQSGPPPT